ncbi:MAG: CgeB family protein [Gemmatimonadales bacterium]
MRIVMFYHSLVSDWNHGNAHFLRGVVAELLARGHQVTVLEPEHAWSRERLIDDQGENAITGFYLAYPGLESKRYALESLDLDGELEGADLVMVHEWNEPGLVEAIGRHHTISGGYHLLFHDTHHRSVTRPETMAAYRLESYDGVLAFGEVIRQRYLAEGWAERVWTWHEAADPRVFHSYPGLVPHGDLVWVGNWGDGERTSELEEFLIAPVEALGLRARVHGVRYPPSAKSRLSRAGMTYGGWLPNYEVPSVFARFRLTVHIPRRPYVEVLPGIPTIRVFEALACGIPLVCSPWDDAEGLFSPGTDYLVARDGSEMRRHLSSLLADPFAAASMAERGRDTVLARHTCAHRVDQLIGVVDELNGGRAAPSPAGALEPKARESGWAPVSKEG